MSSSKLLVSVAAEAGFAGTVLALLEFKADFEKVSHVEKSKRNSTGSYFVLE